MNNTYFKPLFLLFGLLFVIGCQEDVIQEDIQTEAESEQKEITDYVKTNKTFTGSEARKKLKKGFKKMKSIGLPSLQKSSTADSISFSFGTVKTDKVVQTIDVSDKENLVYDIELNDPDPKRFYNLVITTRPDGSESAYLFGYSMSDEFYTAYTTQGEPLSNFEGSTFSLNLDEISPNLSSPSDCEDFMASIIDDDPPSSGVGGTDGGTDDNNNAPSGGTGDYFGGGISGGSSDSGSGSSGSTGTGSGSSGSTGGGGWIEEVWDGIESGGSAVGDAAGAVWDWLSSAASSVWCFIFNCDDTPGESIDYGNCCGKNSSETITGYNYNVQEIDPQVVQPIGEDPCAPVATAIIGDEFSNEYIADFILGIPVEDVILLQSYEYYDFYHESLDFLVENDFSDEALAFFREALEAVKNGGEVDYEERIIKEEEFTENDCLNSVYNQLDISDIASDFLSNFEGHNSVAHLLFSVGVDGDDPDANAVTYDPDNFVIEIMFNPNQLDRPSTDVARTFMHEIIHAEMYRKLLSLAQQGEIPWNESFIQSLKNDFPGLQDYYTRWWLDTNGQNPTNTQHELMAQHYRGTITNFLLQFDSSLSQSQANALAWVGLMGNGQIDDNTGLPVNPTVAWDNLPQQERLTILNTISSFKNSHPNC